VSPEQVIYVRETFGMSQRALAKAMNVAPLTVYRWESGANEPSGLQREVLQALHLVALKVASDPNKCAAIGGKLAMGVGALIYVLLLEELRD